MKRFLTACALGLLTFTALSASAQIRHQYEILDDGAGHFLTIQAPAGMTGPLTWTAPIPPGNVPSGFLNVGDATGQIPWWDNSGTGQWSKSTNFYWDNTNGTLTIGGASQSTYNFGLTGTASISGALSLGGNISLSDAGHNIQFAGGNAGTGNDLTILGQAGGTGNGGAITITGGGGGVDGGAVSISGGSAGSGNQGNVSLSGHNINIQDAAPGSGVVNINTLVSSGSVHIEDGAALGNTSIGNTTGTLTLTSNNINVSSAGAITGATGLTTTGNVNVAGAQVLGASPLVFEGATDDNITTTFAITDPTTTSKTITFPDATGTVSLLSATGTTDQIPKFTSASALGNSSVSDNGITFNINSGKFTVTEASGNTTIAGSASVNGTSTFAGDAQATALRVHQTSPGGPTGWAGLTAIGGTTNTVALGELDGLAQIGGHTATLGGWSDLYLNSSGTAKVRVGSETAPSATLDVTGSIGAAVNTGGASGPYAALTVNSTNTNAGTGGNTSAVGIDAAASVTNGADDDAVAAKLTSTGGASEHAYGIQLNVTGGLANTDIQGTSNTWNISAAGDASLATIAATNASNQIALGATGHVLTVSSTAPAAATQTYTIPDAGAAANFVLSTFGTAGQAISGGNGTNAALQLTNGTVSNPVLSLSDGTNTAKFIVGAGSPNLTLPSASGTLATTGNTVNYDVTSAQAGASTGTDKLFSVSYAGTPGTTTAGAVINSTTSGTNVSATGLTVTAHAVAAGGTATGISVAATGATTNTALDVTAGNANFADNVTLGSGIADLITFNGVANSALDMNNHAINNATTVKAATSVTSPLHIGSTSANGTLTIEGNSSTGNTATNDNLLLKVGDNAATTALHILNNGKIGIGASTPSGLLDNNGVNTLGSDGAGISDQTLNWSTNMAGYVATLYNNQTAAGSNNNGLEVKIRDASSIALDVSTGAQGTQGISLFTVTGAGNANLSGGLTLGVESATPTAGTIVFNDATDNGTAGPTGGFTGTLLVKDPLTASQTYTLPDASGTVALTGNTVNFDVTSTQSSTTAANNLFDVTSNVTGASLGAKITTTGTTNSTGLTIAATAGAGNTATGLSVSAGGGTTNTAINVTGGNVNVAGNIATSGSGTITSNGDLKLTNATPKITATDGAGLTITDGTNTLLTLADNTTTGTLTVDKYVASTNVQAPTVQAADNTGAGSALTVRAGNGSTTGGALTINGGSGAAGVGGDVAIVGGDGSTTDGAVNINTTLTGNTSIGNSAGTLTLTGSNAALSSAGVLSLAGNQSPDITTTTQTGANTGNRLYIQAGTGGPTGHGADLYVAPGYGGAVGQTGGSFYIQSSPDVSANLATRVSVGPSGDFATAGPTFTSTVGGNAASVFKVQEGSNSYIAVTTTNGSENVTLGNSTTNPSFTLAGTGKLTTGGATVLGSGHATQATTAIPNNVTVYTVDDDAGTAAPFTLTLPSAGTDGQVLYFINKDADDTATIGSDTYTTGHGGTYVYFHTAGWTRVSSF